MDKWTFLELAKKVLEEERKPLSPEEIWETAERNGYDKNVGSEGKTPWRTLEARLYVDLRDNKGSSFSKVGSRPVRFYLRSSLSEEEALRLTEERGIVILHPKRLPYLERDLHPFLAHFANYYLKAYTKTIQHTKSDKKEYGEWIHPDMVGCYFPFDDWESEVVDLSKEISNVSVKLFSFEIKKELNFSNLRESFFQSVSNSSWANEGYLVASDISNEKDFQDELERFSSSFGIGIIGINIEDPDSSEVLFPARNKSNLDWETVNKLTMNPDFSEFLKRVRTDISSKEVRKEKYDKVLPKEELIRRVKG